MPLTRGANTPLTREVPSLRTAVVGVNWDTGADAALNDRLAMATILCGADGKAVSPEALVFFNQMVSADTSIAQSAAAVGGDDEQVEVDLNAVPPQVHRIVFALYVAESLGARQPLSRLRQCVVRVLNAADGAQVAASEDLAAGLGDETAVMLGELYRHGTEWKFKVIGQGYQRGLVGVCEQYGVAL